MQQFHFEPAAPGYGNYRGGAATNFCADITLDGQTYKGYGKF